MAKKSLITTSREQVYLYKEAAFVGALLCIAAFLRFYLLDQTMQFIGDFGWFYVSAKNMLIEGNIPLIGIASSHPWIHQGAFWTYLLALVLPLGSFHPVLGGYLAAGIGVVTVCVIYIFAKKIV